MKDIIRLKHWQVFCILALSHLISFILSSVNFEIGSITSHELAIVTTIITLILLFSWTLTIGLFLNNLERNNHYFKNWVLIFAVICCMIGYSQLNLQRISVEIELTTFWYGFITGFTFWGVCYTFYHVAKSLKSVELNREANFSEFIIDAITLFMFPIGVWFIQPRINRILMIEETNEKQNKEVTNH